MRVAGLSLSVSLLGAGHVHNLSLGPALLEGWAYEAPLQAGLGFAQVLPVSGTLYNHSLLIFREGFCSLI